MRFAFVSSILVLSVALHTACTSSVVPGDPTGSGGDTATTSASTMSASGSTSGVAASSSGTGGPVCTTPPSPAVFEGGSGQACFERLTSGQTVSVMQGPQGGYHLWLAVGCGDCTASTILQYGIKDPATKTWYAGTSPQKVAIDLGGSGWSQHAGFTAFLPGVVYDPTTQLAKGTHVLLSALVLAADGGTLHAADTEVVLGDVEIYYPPCDPDPKTCGMPGGTICCSDVDGG